MFQSIPTRVGRTRTSQTPDDSLADHPHARGENVCIHGHSPGRNGPSPRAWGEPTESASMLAAQRTIPTRVGRTDAASRGGDHNTDHPHARGENATSAGILPSGVGPSPRAWGEPPLGSSAKPTIRTIPTRVGRTSVSCSSVLFNSDHPHARGENSTVCASNARWCGPSPRAWGEP